MAGDTMLVMDQEPDTPPDGGLVVGWGGSARGDDERMGRWPGCPPASSWVMVGSSGSLAATLDKDTDSSGSLAATLCTGTDSSGSLAATLDKDIDSSGSLAATLDEDRDSGTGRGAGTEP